jgi:hypothetical protein
MRPLVEAGRIWLRPALFRFSVHHSSCVKTTPAQNPSLVSLNDDSVHTVSAGVLQYSYLLAVTTRDDATHDNSEGSFVAPSHTGGGARDPYPVTVIPNHTI